LWLVRVFDTALLAICGVVAFIAAAACSNRDFHILIECGRNSFLAALEVFASPLRDIAVR